MNTKNKSKKGIIGITLAAIMIASIFAVLPLPVLSNIPGKQCEHPQPGGLVVDIVYPANGTVKEVCDNFYVNAVIANMNDTLNFEDVLVNITISGGTAELVPVGSGDAFDSKSLGTLADKDVVDVWWELHCNESGPVTITVEATSTTDSIYNSSDDSVTVEQRDGVMGTVLEIEIFQAPAPDELIDVCDVFAIKANITNIGGSTLNDVTANITWDVPGAVELRNCTNWTLGTMKSGAMHEVGWTLHCNGSGYVNVTVGATASGIDVEQINTSTVRVHQKMPANLTANITAPENESKICTDYPCDNTFVVTAIITNTGDETASSVRADIEAIVGTDNVEIEYPDWVDLGDIPGGESRTASWNVTCNATGAATLMVSPVSGTVQATSDNVTIYQDDIIVEILEPADPSTYSTCQDFEVVARIKNCQNVDVDDDINVTLDFRGLGANLTNTTVSIETSLEMTWSQTELTMTELEEGLYYVLLDESFCDCCWANLTWSMECIDDSDGTIEVYAENASDTNMNDSDSVSIIQEWKADLAAGVPQFYRGLVDLDDPESDMFLTTPVDAVTVCQNFSVVVPVINWGEANATNVSVGIDILQGEDDVELLVPGTLTQSLGTIEGNESAKAIWNFHCKGEGMVKIKVLRELLTGRDENTGMEVLSDNKHVPTCSGDLDQIPFRVEIIEPDPEEDTDFLVGQQWTVKVNLSNDDSDKTLSDLNATLRISGNAELVTGQDPSVHIEELDPGQWTHAPTWQMNCTGAGDVVIDVVVTSRTPAHTIYSNEVTVHQKLPADVTVELLSPIEQYYSDYTYIPTSTEFMVTGKISNADGCLDATITDADVIIDDDIGGGTAHVVSGPDLPIVLAGGQSQIVSWTLHADKCPDEDLDDPEDQDTEIWIEVEGEDAFGNDFAMVSNDEYIYVYPAAHLEVVITVPDDGSRQAFGSDFWVNATITNTGQADVWEGQATLSVVPENSILLAEGGYTIDLGSLVGHGADGSANVSWKVQCEELGKSTITVTASGKDECGYFPWPCLADCDYPGYYYLIGNPGRAIPEDHIEPASITVKQVTEEELEEPFDDNITLVTGWNFISVPKKLDTSQDQFGELFFGISLGTSYRYDPTTFPYWFSLTLSDPVEVLNGYWIDSNEDVTIELSYLTGGQMVPPSKDLAGKAWNAIGFSSVTAMSASTTLKSVEGSWSTVIGWDETGQQYESAIIYQVNDEALMYPGKGYWDWMTADDTLSAVSA